MNMQNIKVKGQFVQKIEWKETNGRTSDTTDHINFPANAVSRNVWMGARCKNEQ